MDYVTEATTPDVAPVNIPLLYANGTVVARSLTELQITMNMNGKPVCLIVIPFPVGKSLSESLTTVVKDQVTKTGYAIPDLKELFDKENAK